MSNYKVQPVILCGGSGTRLWPLSRVGFPKQFLVLSGTTSLYQEALNRVTQLSAADIDVNPPMVVTNEEHRFLAKEQLSEVSDINGTFLLEPEGRNTAPAITLAALEAQVGEADPILVVTPADQIIQNVTNFTSAIQQSIRLADKGGIVILGISPNKPETGYGYIECEGETGIYGEQVVKQFTEKPSLDDATVYLSNGKYTWNSGIFILRASTWLKALSKFRSDILDVTRLAWEGRKSDLSFVRPDKKIFETIPSESIDYAVIEKCPSSDIPISMISLDAGWSDLGAWDAVWELNKVYSEDEKGNVSKGDVILQNAENNYVYSTSRLVGLVGVSNLIVIDTSDALLIAERKQSQKVRLIVNELKKEGRIELNMHRKVHRPWGWYDTVDLGERFKVKRIQVKEGASLSIQTHQHRAEHWIVVKGVANVLVGESEKVIYENESIYIPKGEKHCLKNLGSKPLEIIEVQTGEYLGEDDIIRHSDIYGRDVKE